MDFNVYYDVEEFSVFTVNLLANMDKRFQYFSLTNYYSPMGTDDLGNTESFYTEQNVRWGLPSNIPADLTLQWNMRSGERNDRVRLGFRWKANATNGVKEFLSRLRTNYTINFHLYQFDFQEQRIWQMEHVYRINLLSDRLYLGGFGDHTFGGADGAKWVTEHQLGLRLTDEFYAVAEVRINEYRVGNEASLGLGVEYVIRYD